MLALALLVVPGNACSDGVQPPSSAPEPVAQVLLMAGAAQQAARIEFATPADSLIGLSHRPVPAASVHLALDGGGTLIPFTRDPVRPYLYQAAHQVAPGLVYHLLGEIAGRPVGGAVTVPGEVVIRIPAQDTVRVPAGRRLDLPYVWSAPGAGAYLARFIFQDVPGEQLQQRVVRDTAGTLSIFPFRDRDTASVIVTAYDVNASSFLFASTPVTSLTGVFGMLGAATPAARRLTVIWE